MATTLSSRYRCRGAVAAPGLGAAASLSHRESQRTAFADLTRCTQPTQADGPLTPQRDRSHEFMRALVACPGVADAPLQAELRFLGDQQNAAATRTPRSAKILRQRLTGTTGKLDAHRRPSSTLALTAPRPVPIMFKRCPESVASLRRHYETLVAVAAQKSIQKPTVWSLRGLRRDMLMELRHDLLRHQLHCLALGGLVWPEPVEAGHEQRTERPDFVAEGDQLVEDRFCRAV